MATIDDLVTSTTALTAAVNVSKTTLDTKVAAATTQAGLAATQAGIATVQAAAALANKSAMDVALAAGSLPSISAFNAALSSPTGWVKDQLRATIEAASGGRATVLYTAAGNPTYMNIIPAFNKEDISAACGTGRHEAFIVNGVNKSELFYGTYPGSIVGAELVSQPMVHPAVSRNFDTFRIAAAACGAGHHLVTNAERAAVALWCWKNGFQPRGNNNWGRDVTNTWETGRRTDGVMPGVASGDGATLTGSGPVSWRHDNTSTGIADMNGNVWEWSTGMRINNGEIQVLPNNNAADNTLDVSATSALWQAIDGATGALVAPGSANTVKYAASGTTAYTLVRASGATFEGMTNPSATPVSAAALAVMTSLGMFPVAASGLGADIFYLDVTGERVPFFGGAWNISGGAGVFALSLDAPRSSVYGYVGARPAYVL